MRHFWSIYLATAIVGTAGVYTLAPLARPFARRFHLNDGSLTSSLTSDRLAQSDDAGTERREVQTQNLRAHEEPVLPESGMHEEVALSPSSLGIHLVSRGDVMPTWGLLSRRAEYFMMDGISVDFLEADKMIDYRSTHYSPKGAMVEFMIDSPDGIPTTPYLISQRSLFLFTATYKGLSSQQLRDLKACYGLAETHQTVKSPQVLSPPKGIHLVHRGDLTPGWGVVRQQSNGYLPDGRRIGFVEAGSLVDYQRAVSSSKGPMVECLICTTNGEPSVRSLIHQNDLHLFSGSHRDLSEKQRSDLRAYYALAGRIVLRRNELLQASAAKNPFFADYQSAYQALMTHIDKSRVEVSRRDHAVGAEKVKAQERLFEKRMEERRLRMEYDEVQTKFKDWKKENADDLQSPDDDLDVRLWTKLKVMKAPDISGLAY